MLGLRSGLSAMVLLALPWGSPAQSLAEVARRADAERKASAAAPAVFDARDLDAGLAQQELFGFEIDPARWGRYVAADGRVALVFRNDPAISTRLNKVSTATIRSLERFFQREPALAAALKSAGTDPHEFAYTHLAMVLATDKFQRESSSSWPAVKANIAFLETRSGEMRALAVPASQLAMKITAPSREPAPIAPVLPGPRPSVPPAAPAPGSEDGFISGQVGSEVPDFAFTDFDGRARRLSEFRGRYVLLDFWGSWCAPCRAELPFAKDAYARFRSRGFEIVGLNYERGATPAEVRKVLMDNGVQWTFSTADSVRDLITTRFRIESFPTVILIGPDSMVIEARSGSLRGAQLAKTLDRILPKG